MTFPKPSLPATASSAPALDSSCTVELRDPTRVPAIPRSPEPGASFDIRSPDGHPAYTHYLFRFPAKFHPPVVSMAKERTEENTSEIQSRYRNADCGSVG